MKLIDRYIKLKAKYPNDVVLIKNGYFYNTYYDDALLISNLCNYKINNNKVGFPINNLSNIRDI